MKYGEEVPMKAIVVIPTYNEHDNLPELIHKIRHSASDLDILIVDDNSPDGTGGVAESLAAKCAGKISVLHRARKEGLGKAYLAGFKIALLHGYDAILQMDGDLSHDPSYLPVLLSNLSEADVVCGSRYLRGINVVSWDFKRLLLSKAASEYVRIITRMPVSDPTSGFKAWRRRTLEMIGLDRVCANGYLFQIEMTYRAFMKHMVIREVPIIFYERSVGCSKMDFQIVREAVFGVPKLRLLGLNRE